MTRLGTIQRWAERFAQKLGVPDRIKVIPRSECPTSSSKGSRIHCHMTGVHRGTICWDTRDANRDSRGWKWIIAHEVCHLKVQSHSSPYFARYMARLGFAREKRQAQLAGLLRHRHEWYYFQFVDDQVRQTCSVCGAIRTGKVLWGTIKKGKAK